MCCSNLWVRYIKCNQAGRTMIFFLKPGAARRQSSLWGFSLIIWVLLLFLALCGSNTPRKVMLVSTPGYLYGVEETGSTPNVIATEIITSLDLMSTRPPAPGVEPSATRVLPIISPAPHGMLTSSGVDIASEVPNLVDLQVYLFELVNAERGANKLTKLSWDVLATSAGQLHAEEMATQQFLSHWNQQGYGPDIRFNLIGGTEWVQENVFGSWNRYTDGRPVPIDDWKAQVKAAFDSWMASPGHRANILDPAHTHLGVGIAYNSQTGDLRMTQEFINRYIELEAIPSVASLGDTIYISGRLLKGAVNPIINLAYEPFPKPITNETLNSTSTFLSPAEFFQAIDVEYGSDGRFEAEIVINESDIAGLYHIRVWVTVMGQQVQTVDWTIWINYKG